MNIGTLTIEMAANIARLKQDMEEAKSTVAAAMKAIEGAANLAQKAIVGIVGIASFEAFKSMVDGVIEAKAALEKLSIQTSVSVEALSAIGATAKLTGTNINDVASAMNKLQKNLATSNEDSKGTATALKAINIEFDSFKALKPDDQMLAVAKALDKFEDGGGKSAAMMLLFGKTGAELLPMMRELAEKSELVGKTTSASAEQAEQYEQNLIKLKAAGDTWKRMLVDEMLPVLEKVTNAMVKARTEGGLLASVWAGMKAAFVGDDQHQNNEVMIDQMDRILAIQKNIDQLHAAGYTDDTRVVRSRQQELAQAQALYDTALKANRAIEDANNKEAQAAAARDAERKKNGQVNIAVPDKAGTNQALLLLDSLKTKYEQLIGRTSEYEQVERKLAAMKKEADPILRAQIEKTAQAIDQLNVMNKLSESQVAYLKARSDAQERLEDDWGSSLKELQELAAAQDRDAALLGKTSDEVERLRMARELEVKVNKELGTLYAARADDLISETELRRRVTTITQAQADAMDALARKQSAAEDRRRDPMTGISDSLRDYQLTAARIGDSFKQLSDTAIGGLEDRLSEFFAKGKTDWKSYFQNILQEMIRLQVVRPFMQQMLTPGGGGAGLLSGLGGGAFGNLSSSIRSMMNGGFAVNNVLPDTFVNGMYASGGRPTPGTVNLVGEQGPELFVPDSAGTVVPNGSLGGTVFAPVTHINVDSRSDRAAVMADVQGVVQANNRAFVGELRKQGVLA